jgi:hypothetical protein
VTARCPSDLALESFLLAPERSPLKRHVDACEPCRGRIARMEAEGEEFRQYVFPATVDAVREAARPRRARWASLLAPIGALAAVGAAALLVLRTGPAGPAADYVGVKGEPKDGKAGLKVFVDGAEGARAVEDGGAVPAGAALRFRIAPDAGYPCYLWILSVDGRGAVSQLYPPKGTPVENRAVGPVPGGAVLDGQPGPERIFAVCADTAETTWDDVRRAAAPAVGGADAVRRARKLAAPLDDECQSSLLLEKR